MYFKKGKSHNWSPKKQYKNKKKDGKTQFKRTTNVSRAKNQEMLQNDSHSQSDSKNLSKKKRIAGLKKQENEVFEAENAKNMKNLENDSIARANDEKSQELIDNNNNNFGNFHDKMVILSLFNEKNNLISANNNVFCAQQSIICQKTYYCTKRHKNEGNRKKYE